MSSVRFCSSFFIDLTNLLYFVFLFVVPLFTRFWEVPLSTGFGRSTLEPEEMGRVSLRSGSAFGAVSFGAGSEEIWRCDAEGGFAGTVGLGDEKK
jgi:hypothetical protein